MCAKSTDLWHTPTASGHSPSHEKRYPGGKTRRHPIPNLAAEVERGKPYAQQVRERNAPTASHQSTFLPEGSLASLTVLPGSEEAQKMTVTSGRNISGLLKRQDRDTSLPRTFLESCPPTSTRCYLTWKVRRTPAGRSIFQLAPSMPRTDGSESSLWATPNTLDSMPPKSPEALHREATTARPGRSRPANLRDQVSNSHLWPTPKAVMVEEEYEGWRSRMAGYSDPKSNTKTKPDNLAVAVKMWPTPSANEDAAGTPQGNMQKMLGNHPDVRAQGSGTLNPTWVEWLMGFPSGFTDLED